MIRLSDVSSIRMAGVADIRPAAEALRDIMVRLGNLRVAATDNIAGPRAMVDADGALLATTVFGWTEQTGQWWNDARFTLRTPLAEASRMESQPFWANMSGAWNAQGERILTDFDFSYFGTLVAHPASIVVPVHLPLSRIGLIALSCADGRRSDLSAELRAHFDMFYLLGHLFIEDYAKLARDDKWQPGPASLTRLEVTCLRWVGRGKTDDEIALIMGRARPTIRFHLRNAATKLDAVNRAQAVFRATQLGFLSTPSGMPPPRRGGADAGVVAADPMGARPEARESAGEGKTSGTPDPMD